MVSQDAPYLGSSFCHVSLGPASHPARKGEQVPLEEHRPVGAHRLVLLALGAGAAHLACFPLPAPRGQSSPCLPHLEVLVLTSLPSALWCGSSRASCNFARELEPGRAGRQCLPHRDWIWGPPTEGGWGRSGASHLVFRA